MELLRRIIYFICSCFIPSPPKGAEVPCPDELPSERTVQKSQFTAQPETVSPFSKEDGTSPYDRDISPRPLAPVVQIISPTSEKSGLMESPSTSIGEAQLISDEAISRSPSSDGTSTPEDPAQEKGVCNPKSGLRKVSTPSSDRNISKEPLNHHRLGHEKVESNTTLSSNIADSSKSQQILRDVPASVRNNPSRPAPISSHARLKLREFDVYHSQSSAGGSAEGSPAQTSTPVVEAHGGEDEKISPASVGAESMTEVQMVDSVDISKTIIMKRLSVDCNGDIIASDYSSISTEHEISDENSSKSDGPRCYSDAITFVDDEVELP